MMKSLLTIHTRIFYNILPFDYPKDSTIQTSTRPSNYSDNGSSTVTRAVHYLSFINEGVKWLAAANLQPLPPAGPVYLARSQEIGVIEVWTQGYRGCRWKIRNARDLMRPIKGWYLGLSVDSEWIRREGGGRKMTEIGGCRAGHANHPLTREKTKPWLNECNLDFFSCTCHDKSFRGLCANPEEPVKINEGLDGWNG